MLIKKLFLSNFRCFESLDFDFHNKLTVIVAPNGQGKTTILDAVTIALGTFVGAFDLGNSKHIEQADARFLRQTDSLESEQQYPVTVSANFSDPEVTVLRERTGKKSRTTIKKAAEISNYGQKLMLQIRELKEITLPAVAYYGSGRFWNTHKNMTRKSVLSESRSMGYEDCLSPASNFKQVQQWMAKATYAVMQQKEMPEYSKYKLAEQVNCIKQAVDQVLAVEGWRNFHYSLSHEELVMYHPEHGILPLSLLSDGVRAMVSLTVDLAWRCARLNPHLGEEASVLTKGIVLIDEVDIHLHPGWQQKVIQTLLENFPGIQFIVTTHSPQVLSTVPAESIRLLKHTADPKTGRQQSVAETPLTQSRGVASAEIMAALMDVDPVPDIEESRWLSEYKAMIQQNLHNMPEAETLRRKLEQHFGSQHQELLECDRMIRLAAMKTRLVADRKQTD